MRVLSSYTTSFVVLTATTFMILKSSEAFMTVKSPSSAAFVSLPSTLFPMSHHHDHQHHSALFSSEQEEAEATVEKEEQTEEEEEGEDDEVPQPKAKSVEDILRDLHTSALPFRIVVIGNGAILETTTTLTPTFKSSISPKSNEKLITIANSDQSFEFHVKVEQVSKVTFTETDKKDADGTILKTLRIIRMLNDVGKPICSLILADGGTEDGVEWFNNMRIRYGYEVQL